MDAELFTRILSDRNFIDLRKIKHKYPDADLPEMIRLLQNGVYRSLPLLDFSGKPLVWLECIVRLSQTAVRLMSAEQHGTGKYALRAMEDEIISSLSIESIDTSRDSVRRILQGYAPQDDSEKRIYGLKCGLDFISDACHDINEENIYKLYQLAIGDHLDREDDRLLPGRRYRHDSVYIVGIEVEHTGLRHDHVPRAMADLISFIQADDETNDLLKAAIIHFFIAYIHPWFDGNGRMARLLHLWYLLRLDYPSVLFVPFSAFIESSRRKYYNAFTLIERNQQISGVLDVTPFLTYFAENVYNRLGSYLIGTDIRDLFNTALAAGQVTEKERELWQFTQSAYGSGEFTTKMLERDFGRAAYATIRSYVLKFEQLGLLTASHYGNKVKYRLAKSLH